MARRGCIPARMRRISAGTRSAENQLLSRVQQFFPQKKAEWEYAFDGEDDACYELLTTRLHELENAGEVMISDRWRA